MSAEAIQSAGRPAQPQEAPRGSVVVDVARRFHVRMLTQNLRPSTYVEPTKEHRPINKRLAIIGFAVAGAAVALEALKAAGVPVPAPSDLLPGSGAPTKVPTDVGPLPFGYS